MSKQKVYASPLDYGAELEEEIGVEEFNSMIGVTALLLMKYGILYRPKTSKKFFRFMTELVYRWNKGEKRFSKELKI